MSNSSSKKPSHNVYSVRENGKSGGSDYWTKIGVAFAHNDGKGFSVMLDCLPVDGKITIRTAEPKDKAKS